MTKGKRSAADIAVALIPAVLATIGGIIAAFLSYSAGVNAVRIPLIATQTAEARLTLTAPFPTLANAATTPPVATPSLTRQKGAILSERSEIFDFDDGDTSGWKPFEWSDGWISFEKSGNIEVVGKDFVLDGHSGPFLKYPLDLWSQERHQYLKRNAIYKPVDEKVIGILANIFYEGEKEYSFEKICAGFVVPYQAGSEVSMNEDYMKMLIPNRWNTIIWSLYGPVWWNAEDKSKEWEEFKELFGDRRDSMQPGLRLDHNKIGSIGIQFYVYTGDGPKQFKGTVYIDNIALIYRHVP